MLTLCRCIQCSVTDTDPSLRKTYSLGIRCSIKTIIRQRTIVHEWHFATPPPHLDQIFNIMFILDGTCKLSRLIKVFTHFFLLYAD